MTDASSAGAVPAPAPVDDARSANAGPPLDATFRGALVAIWLRELRGRMRGKKAFIFITVYLGCLVALLWLGLRGPMEAPLGAMEEVTVGRAIFAGVILIETLVVVALAPAYTAGLISSELEKQTFDLLAVTPVSSLAIVVGKLLSGLSYLALLVGLSIPLASLAFLFGGIAVESFLLGYLLLFVVAVGVGSVGVACSAVMRRTQPATVAAFLAIAVVVLGATAGWGVLTGRAQVDERASPPPEALLYLNPFLAQADLLCETTTLACIPGVTIADPFAPDVGLVPGPGALWPRIAISWILVGGLMLFLASQAVSPTRRWRPGRPAASRTKPEATEPES